MKHTHRMTIVLEEKVYLKLVKIKIRKIKSKNRPWSFSKVVNEILREVLGPRLYVKHEKICKFCYDKAHGCNLDEYQDIVKRDKCKCICHD